MLEARKENKVYMVDATQTKRYLMEGFDIYENGKIVEHSPLKKIGYGEHLRIVEEAKSKALVAEDVTELLKKYAEVKGIEIGSSTSANGILEKILKAEKVEE